MTRMWLGSPASATIMAFSQASCEMRSGLIVVWLKAVRGRRLSSSFPPAAISAILIIFLVWKGLPDTRCMGLLV